MPPHNPVLASIILLCLIGNAGAAAAADDLSIEGKWMVLTMGTASDPSSPRQTLEPGRYTIEIHGKTLVSTAQWGPGMTPEVQHDAIEIASSSATAVSAVVTLEKGGAQTWSFKADGKGITATFPDLLLALVPFDADAAAKTAQHDQDDAPGGPPIADHPLSGTIEGKLWTAMSTQVEEAMSASQECKYDILAHAPQTDEDIEKQPYLHLTLPKTMGPFPFKLDGNAHIVFHVPPNETLSSSQIKLVVYSRSEREIVIGLSAHFNESSTISGKFTIELPQPPTPREAFSLDGKWMVRWIKSTKPGEVSSMDPEPGAMTVVIKGQSVETTVIMMPDDDGKPDESTLEQTPINAGKITATVSAKDGTKQAWTVTADDQGMTVMIDNDQEMRLIPWNEAAVAAFNAQRQDALQPARPLAEGVLSGIFDGVPWKASSCIRSNFQMHKDKVSCIIAAVAQKPNDLSFEAPNIMISLPTKTGTYPFSGTCNATFCTPPNGNSLAIRGQLVIFSVTKQAITFGLSARADKNHDVTGRFTCDLTVPVDTSGPLDDKPDSPDQGK